MYFPIVMLLCLICFSNGQDLRKISSKNLYVSDSIDWLTSRFHFSFADYYNPNNMDFGVLRVMNDDIVQPMEGFPRHPHRDMEIVSYIVDGELTHQDSKGNQETLGPNSVQYMSAGTGIYHSEMNSHSSKPVRFIQIWIKPDRTGHVPNYGSKAYDSSELHNKFLHIITNKQNQNSDIIGFNQDANIYVSRLDSNSSLVFEMNSGRQAYLLCIEGSVQVNSELLEERDAMEIRGEGKLSFVTTDSSAHLLIVEMKRT